LNHCGFLYLSVFRVYMEALKLELMNPTLYQTISLPSHELVEESQVYNNSLINSSV